VRRLKPQVSAPSRVFGIPQAASLEISARRDIGLRGLMEPCATQDLRRTEHETCQMVAPERFPQATAGATSSPISSPAAESAAMVVKISPQDFGRLLHTVTGIAGTVVGY
jgi:hypothetical protein